MGFAVPGTVVAGMFITPAAKVQWDIEHHLPATMSQENVDLLLGLGAGVFVLSLIAGLVASRR